MNWGWIGAVQQAIKDQADLARRQEDERKQKQEENWKAIVKYFSETKACRYTVEKFKSGEWADWLEENFQSAANFSMIGFCILVILLPAMYHASETPGGDSFGIRLMKLIAVGIVILTPFVAGKRKLLKGNITAMKLVRMDHNGHPIGRETAMTRQDIDQVRSFFSRTAKLVHLGGFEIGTYAIYVDRDYKRKFTLYFNAADASVFRASRHFWTWRLSERESKNFYGFLQKYVERLGESEEMNRLTETEKQDT